MQHLAHHLDVNKQRWYVQFNEYDEASATQVKLLSQTKNRTEVGNFINSSFFLKSYILFDRKRKSVDAMQIFLQPDVMPENNLKLVC